MALDEKIAQQFDGTVVTLPTLDVDDRGMREFGTQHYHATAIIETTQPLVQTYGAVDREDGGIDAVSTSTRLKGRILCGAIVDTPTTTYSGRPALSLDTVEVEQDGVFREYPSAPIAAYLQDIVGPIVVIPRQNQA